VVARVSICFIVTLLQKGVYVSSCPHKIGRPGNEMAMAMAMATATATDYRYSTTITAACNPSFTRTNAKTAARNAWTPTSIETTALGTRSAVLQETAEQTVAGSSGPVPGPVHRRSKIFGGEGPPPPSPRCLGGRFANNLAHRRLRIPFRCLFQFLLFFWIATSVVVGVDGNAPLPNGCGSLNCNTGLQKVVSDWIAGGSLKTAVIAQYGQIEDWNVLGVTSLSYVFSTSCRVYPPPLFNADLSNWQVDNVTNLQSSK
jgi:hypothetical protein